MSKLSEHTTTPEQQEGIRKMEKEREERCKRVAEKWDGKKKIKK